MPWLKVDDQLPSHPKSTALEIACGAWEVYCAATLLWRDVGCDCSHNLTEGRFTRTRALNVLPRSIPVDVIDRALAALVASGFVDADTAPHSYVFHDWNDYNPTRDEVLEKRRELSKKRAAAGSKGGNATSANRKTGKRRSKRAANGQQTGSNESDKQSGNDSSNGVPPFPFPSPIPDPKSDPSSPTPSRQPAPAESVEAPKSGPTMTKNEPVAALAAPSLDPESTDPTDLLNALAASSGNVFDRFAGGDAELPFLRRLADYGINVRRAHRLGSILAKHPTTMPKMWVKQGEKIRMSLLMGPCGSNGQRGGTWLSVAVGLLEAGEAAEARRNARLAAPPAPAAPRNIVADEDKAGIIARVRAESNARKNAALDGNGVPL